MDKIKIRGGNPLFGKVYISGAKNTALPIICATLLSDEPSTIRNLPILSDIKSLNLLLEQIGTEISGKQEILNQHNTQSFTYFTPKPKSLIAPYDYVRKMRASYYVLGPLLTKYGHVELSLPGGCAIGARPMDIHLSSLEKMGANIEIKNKIKEDLTYRDINNDIDNLWSVLFSTGYLTGTVEGASRIYNLYIPNLEVHDLFVDQISTWFESKVRRDTSSAEKFYNAAVTGDCAVMEKVLCRILGKSISIRDTFVSKDLRENFYHGFLLGLLQSYPEVYSNRESGNGFSDIMIVDDDSDTAAILELKYSDKDTLKAMENSCREALDQIKRMKYDENPRLRVVDCIRKYGISFNRKIACVRIE